MEEKRSIKKKKKKIMKMRKKARKTQERRDRKLRRRIFVMKTKHHRNLSQKKYLILEETIFT